jgi:D-alanyl-D-alanine endopeptidase (penicillin-binding protein 7)
VLVLACLVLAPLAAAKPAATEGPQLRSNALLVVDAGTSDVLLARNAAAPTAIASITKLMTALVVLDGAQPLEETVTIAADEVRATRGNPSRLQPGARLTRADLLHLALMASENRAAHALARSYPGGVAACVAAMNRKAAALGMRRTRFADPTGLSAGNVSTPEDLARLVDAAARDPVIREFSTDPAHTVRVGRQLVEFRNTDHLVRDPGWDIVVQKTGFTHEAGRCLVLKANVDGRPLVMVLMDSVGKYSRFADARRIRKWLAAQAATPRPVVPAVLVSAGR